MYSNCTSSSWDINNLRYHFNPPPAAAVVILCAASDADRVDVLNCSIGLVAVNGPKELDTYLLTSSIASFPVLILSDDWYSVASLNGYSVFIISTFSMLLPYL